MSLQKERPLRSGFILAVPWPDKETNIYESYESWFWQNQLAGQFQLFGVFDSFTSICFAKMLDARAVYRYVDSIWLAEQP